MNYLIEQLDEIIEGKKKGPTMAEQKRLLDLYMRNYIASTKEAPFRVQEKFYKGYMDYLNKLQDKYSARYDLTGAENSKAAKEWMKKHVLFGAGRDW